MFLERFNKTYSTTYYKAFSIKRKQKEVTVNVTLMIYISNFKVYNTLVEF